MFNKKAQSQIISTVLIILLVLAAIVIVWQVVRTTVEETTEEIPGTTECLVMDLKIDKLGGTIGTIPLGVCTYKDKSTNEVCANEQVTGVTDSACVSSGNCVRDTWKQGYSSITVKRGVGKGDLKKIRIIVGGTTAREGEAAGNLVNELSTQVFTGLTIYPGDKVEIAAILAKDRLCPVSDAISA